VSWLLGLLVYAAIGALADGRPVQARDLYAAAMFASATVLVAVLAVSHPVLFCLRHRLRRLTWGANSQASRRSWASSPAPGSCGTPGTTDYLWSKRHRRKPGSQSHGFPPSSATPFAC